MSRNPSMSQAPGGSDSLLSAGGRSLRPKARGRKPGEKRRGPFMGPPPPIGTAYLLRFPDVAARLRMSVSGAWRLSQRDGRFPKAVTAPGCLPRWLEEDVAGYIAALAADRDRAIAGAV